MAIITISRGTHSGGKALAECLAGRLAYRLFDREAIIASASACGALEEKVRHAIETPPSLWDRIREDRRRYMAVFQACLTGAVRSGDAIYLGNAGHLLIRGVSHVLRVRIVAPMDMRVETVQQALGLTREDALAYIQARDRGRASWTRFLYGVDWSDPLLYDVVLNLERSTAKEACELVAAMAQRPAFTETPASRAAMANLALSCAITAALLTDPRTTHLLLDVEADGGTVTISGKVRHREQWLAVRSIAAENGGVQDLRLAGLIQVLDA